jgi:hypothetical protein
LWSSGRLGSVSIPWINAFSFSLITIVRSRLKRRSVFFSASGSHGLGRY